MQDKYKAYQDQAEARPDQFMRYDYKKPLDESREAVAELINAPVDSVVLVGNATEGVNTVFRNMTWAEDGKDVILYFSTAYGSCAKSIDYLVDYFGPDRVSSECIVLDYPNEDDEIIQMFRDTVSRLKEQGKRPRACMFDVVSSLPGIRFPWEDMCKACKELDVLSLVDGAQGIGMVHLDIRAADPDFFISNCHKWLFTPRGCAVFYCPTRNQHLLPTTLGTSHGYEPRTGKRFNPLPPSDQSAFVTNFGFVGTRDNSMYYVIKDAIDWRKRVCGGEDRILAYLWKLNKDGAKLVAEALGTEVLDNSKGTMTNCAMACVALPLWIGSRGDAAGSAVPAQDGDRAFNWMMEQMMSEYNTFLPLFVQKGQRYWVRLSAQIYLDLKDYEFAAKMLKELCERAAQGEYLKA